ncbi:hypothetical protein SCLARK_001307 [Spiroplasma clarkii]|uniref:hypothetical protein n=1 Tax=Spiroplasma clarkii TaxID=2139 RepID=UPI000B582576|nr:hypothetical protein [Spiroplasma clarkii]ARU91843.1 hypothetical protein SCLARK_001307 [Spiroplasma clarkii]
MSEPNYKKEYLNLINENFNSFNINDEDTKLKIKNFCGKFGFDEDKVTKQISNDKILRAWFIKDPSKQMFIERHLNHF